MPPTADSPSRPAPPRPPATPRVLAVVVTHDGVEWIAAALRTLAAQRYPALEVLVVDNASTDGTADAAARRVGEDRVLRLDANVGFGRAVAAALRSDLADGVEHVLLVHDDMALMPDAVQWLVDALESDPTLAIVGPKLREWDEEALLQQVGMSADAFGHAESGLDPGELDQGQHDARGDVLYVSTAGMLVRRELFRTVGGFDARFTAFRDDLDLCWRAWLAGRRVGVVPQAVGYHHGAAAAGTRSGADPTESRYLVERNTLAAMVKNYSARRLAWVLPVGFLLDTLRLAALLLSRRFGEGLAVVRAYAWNLGQLPATLRRRRVVQSTRRQPDSRLSSLFTPGLPRLRHYLDSVLETVAGGSTRALVDADDVGRAGIDPLADQPIQRFLRDRPLILLGVPLLIAFALSLGGFLGPGQIVGGQVAPWPESATTFLRDYLSPWSAEPLGSASFPSPVQPFLGLVSLAAGGGAWLAQRVAVFGLLPLAFVTTLRAGRLVTSRPWPRVVGATAYTVSPVVLSPLGEGRWGIAVLAALLPAVVSLTVTTANPGTRPGVAWRSTALLAIALVVVLAAAPVEGLLGLLAVAAAAVVALLRGWVRPLLRLAVGTGGAVLLLAPWLLDLLRDGGPDSPTLATGGVRAAAVDLPAWRALLGQPAGVDGLSGVLAVLVVLVPAAVLLGALVVGMRARPMVTGALVLLLTLSAAAAWAAAAVHLPLVHAPALLLPGALALSVLAIVVARWSAETLTASDFGLSQVGTAVAGIILAVGLLGGLALLAGGPWRALSVDPVLVPAFIGAEQDRVGPYRVLLLDADDPEDGTAAGSVAVRWELTGADGPAMTAYGSLRDAALTDLLDDVVTRVAAGADASAAATLGVLNVRYVVLVEPDDVLRAALSRQVDLEPLPSTAAVTYRVRTWLPRAGVLPEPAAGRLLATGDPGATDGLPLVPLRQERPGVFAGTLPAPAEGVVVVAEAASPAWRAAVPGGELEQVEAPHINAFRLEAGAAEAGAGIRAAVGGGLRHRVVVALQVVVALILLSLALRPPAGAREQQRRRVESLPTDLVGLADATTTIPRIDPSAPPPGRAP
jgi:GT2 family glycosyltransferase